jgi:uncharacterized alpha-E superfamily protein
MLLSSLAESVYWFGRYMERTESTARLILVNDNLLLDIPPHCNPGWGPLLQITGNKESFREHYPEICENSVIRYLVLDSGNNPGAMLSSIDNARENMRTARALFPKPVWEVINSLQDHVRENGSAALSPAQRYRFLREVIDYCHLLSGKLAASMSHDQIFTFSRLGFNLERADMTSRVIDVRAQNLLYAQGEDLKPFDDLLWKSILDSLAAWQMYRRNAHFRISGVQVLRFLLQDRQFPRAISHCLLQIEQCLYSLAVNETPRRALLEAQKLVRNVNIPAIVDAHLHQFVDDLQLQFMAIHAEISSRYFDDYEQAPDKADEILTTEGAAPARILAKGTDI